MHPWVCPAISMLLLLLGVPRGPWLWPMSGRHPWTAHRAYSPMMEISCRNSNLSTPRSLLPLSYTACGRSSSRDRLAAIDSAHWPAASTVSAAPARRHLTPTATPAAASQRPARRRHLGHARHVTTAGHTQLILHRHAYVYSASNWQNDVIAMNVGIN